MALAFLVLGAQAKTGGTDVLVTIKPVHALVSGVMEGVGTPGLLIEGAASPHAYALRPSDARALARARLIFWLGEELEAFLARPLAALAGKARVVKLIEARGMVVLSARAGGGRDKGGAPADSGEPGGRDPHVWLDADNAQTIVRVAAIALSRADPANRRTYGANAERMIRRIEALDRELRVALAPVKDRPFIVLHDAYRYFSRRYGLNMVAAVTAGSGRQAGARRVAEVRRTVDELEVGCLLAEPQFRPAMVKSLVADANIRTAALDPLGAEHSAGPNAWFELMRGAAKTLLACLAGGG